MSRLQQILNDCYHQHYTRLTGIGSDTLGSLKAEKSSDAMFSQLFQQLPQPGRVLDLGCGSGVFLSWLLRQDGLVVFAVDSSLSQAEQVRKNFPEVEMSCQDALTYLEQSEHKFDCVFCLNVLEHIADEDVMLSLVEKARESLAPGGFFICRVPNAANLLGTWARYNDLTHQRLFTSGSLCQLLEAAGFTRVESLPVKTNYLPGKIRLWLEKFLHQVLFRICGGCSDSNYSRAVYLIGYR